MARRKLNLEKLPHERIPKKTSQGNRKSKMKFSSMNKHRKDHLNLTIAKANEVCHNIVGRSTP